jgi:hypothetical protein
VACFICLQAKGTGTCSYQATQRSDPGSTSTSPHMVAMCCITAMPFYNSKSKEELRFEDYTLGNKFGSNVALPAPTASSVSNGPYGGFSFGFPANPGSSSMPGPFQQQPAAVATAPWPAGSSSSATILSFGGRGFNVQSYRQVSGQHELCTSENLAYVACTSMHAACKRTGRSMNLGCGTCTVPAISSQPASL